MVVMAEVVMLVTLGSLMIALAQAQEASIGLSQRDLMVGETILMELKVTGLSLSSPPSIPVGEGLVAEHNDSKKVNYRTGVVKPGTTTYRYSLSGMKPGIWSIGPLELAPGVSVPIQRLEVGTDFVESSGSTDLEAYLVPRVAYVGQPITYYLRHRSQIKPLSVIWDLPPFEPLVTLSMIRPEESQKAVADSQGTVFESAYSLPLIATQAGDLVVLPARARLEQPVGGQFGQNRFERKMMSSSAARVLIKELPPAPEHFSGFIGQFELKASIEKDRIAVGEKAELTAELSGTGLLQLVHVPLAEIEAVHFYPEEPILERVFEKNTIKSKLFWKIVLVPSVAGEFNLGRISFNVFDPFAEKYSELSVELPIVMVDEKKQTELIKRFDEEKPKQESEHEKVSVLRIVSVSVSVIAICWGFILFWFRSSNRVSWPQERRARLLSFLSDIKTRNQDSNCDLEKAEMMSLQEEILTALYGNNSSEDLDQRFFEQRARSRKKQSMIRFVLVLFRNKNRR